MHPQKFLQVLHLTFSIFPTPRQPPPDGNNTHLHHYHALSTTRCWRCPPPSLDNQWPASTMRPPLPGWQQQPAWTTQPPLPPVWMTWPPLPPAWTTRPPLPPAWTTWPPSPPVWKMWPQPLPPPPGQLTTSIDDMSTITMTNATTTYHNLHLHRPRFPLPPQPHHCELQWCQPPWHHYHQYPNACSILPCKSWLPPLPLSLTSTTQCTTTIMTWQQWRLSPNHHHLPLLPCKYHNTTNINHGQHYHLVDGVMTSKQNAV